MAKLDVVTFEKPPRERGPFYQFTASARHIVAPLIDLRDKWVVEAEDDVHKQPLLGSLIAHLDALTWELLR